MKEIEFRGMDLMGNWYYGLLSQPKVNVNASVKKGHSYISNRSGMPFAYAVRPETVGQYVGTTDHMGIRLYEGDVLIDNAGQKLLIRWSEYGFRAMFKDSVGAWVNFRHFKDVRFMKCIGNIHDNPELIAI